MTDITIRGRWRRYHRPRQKRNAATHIATCASSVRRRTMHGTSTHRRELCDKFKGYVRRSRRYVPDAFDAPRRTLATCASSVRPRTTRWSASTHHRPMTSREMSSATHSTSTTTSSGGTSRRQASRRDARLATSRTRTARSDDAVKRCVLRPI